MAEVSTTKVLQGWTADQIRAMEIEPLEPMLSYIGPEGREDLTVFRFPSITQLYAWRGSGKTNVALGLAGALATGGKFLAYKACRKFKVLYVDGEMPKEQLKERMDAMDLHGFHTVSVGFQEDFLIPSLFTKSGRQNIEDYMQEHQIEVVIFDSISTLFGFDANKEENWHVSQAWFVWMRSTKRAVIFLHHAGKSGMQRGHSSAEDAIDLSIQLRKQQDHDESLGMVNVEMSFDKVRGFVPGARALSISLIRDPDFTGRLLWTWKLLGDAKKEQVFRLLETSGKLGAGTLVKEMGISHGKAREYILEFKRRSRDGSAGPGASQIASEPDDEFGGQA